MEHGVAGSSFKITQDTIDTIHCLLGLNHQENIDGNDRMTSVLSTLLRSSTENNIV